MRVVGRVKETLVHNNQENFTVGFVKAASLGEGNFFSEALILISRRKNLVHVSLWPRFYLQEGFSLVHYSS